LFQRGEEVYKPTLIFDFDGVIHSYTSGWKGADIIPDPPVEGIRKAIQDIRILYNIIIVSSRCYQKGGIKAIEDWLEKYDIIIDGVTGEKPPALLTVDDRAICFDGKSELLLDKILKFGTYMQIQQNQ